MRIELQVDGGFAAFPGLARPFAVDVDALPPDEAGRWRAAVDASRFFARGDAPAPPTSPDARRYAITVTDGERSRTLRLDDAGPVDEALGALLRLLLDARKAGPR